MSKGKKDQGNHCAESLFQIQVLRKDLRAPGFPCNNDDECVRGATCISPNSTRATGQKLCRCKHEDDDEDDDECSSSAAMLQDVKVCSATRLTPIQPVVHACLNSFALPALCAEDSHFDLSRVGSSTAGCMPRFDKCHLIDSMVI
uniref:Uncharacterized protein n=1 Tax=Timema genevievae TaxID=629358 RepID=A0A7R9PLM8_TIMGE|nr:unnamed protein product [Timema genevievae]